VRGAHGLDRCPSAAGGAAIGAGEVSLREPTNPWRGRSGGAQQPRRPHRPLRFLTSNPGLGKSRTLHAQEQCSCPRSPLLHADRRGLRRPFCRAANPKSFIGFFDIGFFDLTIAPADGRERVVVGSAERAQGGRRLPGGGAETRQAHAARIGPASRQATELCLRLRTRPAPARFIGVPAGRSGAKERPKRPLRADLTIVAAIPARPRVVVRGLTQKQLAEISGFSQQYISGLEQGRRNPTVVTLYELATALGVGHLDLLRPSPDE
jgi:DNA-binding XRE family transcriptional regulator